MERNLTDTNDNSNSIPTIDTLLNPQDYLNSDTNILGDLAGGNYEAESLSDRSRLGARLDTSSSLYANPSGSNPNVATARTNVTLEDLRPSAQKTLAGAQANTDFSIKVTYGEGTEDFTTDMRDAIEDAADVWEDAIYGSNFAGKHTLTIEFGGEDLGEDGFEATAGYRELKKDLNGKSMPITGSSTVNTNPSIIGKFTNQEYFQDLMTHEIGHAMGIGTLWELNDLIDPATGNYRADTWAGNAYNEIYNPGAKSDSSIPLTVGVREGSDGLHWREEIFGNELMTHELERPGTSHPLSEMTLGSLEDIGWDVDYRVADAFPNTQTTASL